MSRHVLTGVMIASLVGLASCEMPLGLMVRPQLVSRADYTAEIDTSQKLATVSADFSIETGEANQRIPLLPRKYAVLEAAAPKAELVPESEQLVLWAAEPGVYRVTMRFLTPIRAPSPGMSEIVVPTLIANRGRVVLDLPAGAGKVTATPEAIVTGDETTGDRRRVTLYGPASQELTLRWAAAPESGPGKAAVVATCEDTVTVRHGLASRATRIEAKVTRSFISELRLALPADATPREVLGADIHHWTLDPSDGALVVTLSRRVSDRTVVAVMSEQAIGVPPAEATIGPLAVVGAGRQEGTLRLAAADGLEIEQTGVDGMGRAAGGAEGPALAYSYARMPASVKLRVSERRPKIAVTTETLATIEAGVVTLDCRLRYTIGQRAVRSVTVGIAADCTVLDASGENVLDWEMGQGNVVTVRFRDAAIGTADVALRLQQNLVKVNGIAIPRVEPRGVESDEGLIGVSAGSRVQLRPHESTLTDQVDVSQLPEWMRTGGARLGYRYRQAGGRLSVSTSEVVPHVTVAVLDVVELHSDLLTRTVYVDAQVEGAEVFDLDLLLPAGLTPLRVRGADVADWQLRPGVDASASRLTITLAKGRMGRVPLVLEASRTLSYDVPLSLVAVEAPSAERSTVGLLVIPRTDLNQRVVSSEGLEARPAETVLRRGPDFASVGAIPADTLGFVSSGEWKATLDVTPRVAQVATDSMTVLRLRHGNAAAETVVRCDIQGAGVSELHLRLPPGARNSWVGGPEISSRRLDGDTWNIVLAERRRGAYLLRVTYDRLIGADGRIAYSDPELVGAAARKSWLVISKERPNVDVSWTTADHVRTVTSSDLPSWWRVPADVAAVEMLEASGRSGADWKVDLSVQLLSEADVLEIRATDCSLQTVVSRDGSALTFMTLTVENDGRQFAKVRLPEGRLLWGAYVNNLPVKAVEYGEPETYLVPLLAHAGAHQSFLLTVAYTEHFGRLEGGASDLTFQTPPLDVPIDSMSWEVYLPANYHFTPAVGDRVGNMYLVMQPPEAESPLADQFFSQDRSRMRLVWPVVGPYVWAVLRVAAWTVVVCAALASLWLVARLVRRAASGRKQAWVAPKAWTAGRRLRWAAVLSLVLVLAVLVLVYVGAMHSASVVWDSPRGESYEATESRELTRLNSALNEYARKNKGNLPESVSDASAASGEMSWTTSSDGASNFMYFGAKKNIGNLDQDAVIAAQQQQGQQGFTVLRNSGRVEYVPPDQLESLAATLYAQGDVDNDVVRKDLKGALEGEKDRLARQYQLAKNLRGQSRVRLDEYAQSKAAQTLEEVAERRYSKYAERDSESSKRQEQEAPAGAAADVPGREKAVFTTGEADEAKKEAFKQQAAEVLLEAQRQAGVQTTTPATVTETASHGGRMPVQPVVGEPKPDSTLTPEPPGDERPGEGEPQTEPQEQAAPWADWRASDVQSVSFAPVSEGRSKGTLPIGLVMPEPDAGRYLFARAFSGTDVSQFEIKAVRSGADYTTYIVGGLALAGVLATGIRVVAGGRRGGKSGRGDA